MSSTIHTQKGSSNAGVRPVCTGSSAGAEGAEAHTHDAKHDKIADVATAQSVAETAAPIAGNMPWFQLPVIGPVNGANAPFVFHGMTENIVNAVLFEIPENGSDICHLNVLHKEFILPAMSPWLTHRWDASWAENANKPHIADIKVDEQICAFEFGLPGRVLVNITQAGPSQVFLQMHTPVGDLVVVETVTPVSPQRLRVLHAIYGHPMVPRLVAKVVLYATVVQFEKDVPVWCSKTYESRPALVKSDKAIPAYRRWTRQFYNEKSITFEQAVKNHVRDSMGLPADASLDW
jgi:cholesterol 7-dehydrogenase